MTGTSILITRAQQGARANADICHAACDLTGDGIETMECGAESGTRHARCRRGSSLTFGKR